ncbi:probable palmitoyltransferase ZDHHC24 [Hyalella azteca]|uniref:Palmitoyltransferase n=1 Tax=Hyalella azteca TaxID=294128 RepID=A0A979FWQ6_HYAAZ|nr:probable palmitoyltransferase ZDHHC24 [Hyalella azteca]
MLRTKALSKLLPRSRPERALLTLLVLGVPCAAVWMWLVVLPQFPGAWHSAFILHVVLTVYLLYNVSVNFFLTMRVDASGDPSALPVFLKPGWRYCHYCELNAPARSYHCSDCGSCILRRDHHCRFTGCCVGHHNQRFFVAGLVHLVAGLTYLLVYQWPLVYRLLGVSIYTFPLVLLAPHFAWVWGTITHWGMMVATVHCACVAAWMTCVYVSYTQLRVIITGTTQHEHKHGVTIYNVSVTHNITTALGHRWYLVLFWPHVSSTLASDGLIFTTAADHQELKDI